MSRTTVLAGTFAIIWLAQGAAGQTDSRPRTSGAVVGIPRAQQKPPLPSGPKPRLAGIAPAPSQTSPNDRDGRHDGRSAPTIFYVAAGYPAYANYSGYPAYETYSSYSSSPVYPPPQNVTYVAPSTTNITYVQPAPAVVYSQQAYGQPAYSQPAANITFAQQGTSYFNLPAIVFNDGRVYGNFTGAYEQVLRQCVNNKAPAPIAGAMTPPCWTLDADGRYSIVQSH